MEFWVSAGMPNDAASYITSFDIDWKNDKELLLQNESLYKNGKEEFQKFARQSNLTTFSDLLVSFANNFTQSTKITCESCKNMNVDENGFIANGKLTYKILFDDYCISDNRPSEVYKLNLSNPNMNSKYILNIGKSLELIDANSGFTLNFNNENLKIGIVSVQEVKRIPSGNAECTNNAILHRKVCRSECNEEIIGKCGKCKFVRNGCEGLLEDGDGKRLCSLLNLDYRQCLEENKEELSECYKKCLSPCLNTIYQFTVNRDKAENDTIVIITPTFGETGIFTFEEMSSYSFQSAISNIGGQLGLWLGMGIITIVQIILFCWEKVLDHKFNAKLNPSEITNSSHM